MSKKLSRVIVFFSVFSLSWPLLAEAGHEKKERTITVQGQGKVHAVPDIATLSVEVSHEGAELDPLLAQVRKEMSKVLEAVKAQGIVDKDIQTESFQVHPKYEQDKRGNAHPAGFVVANQLSVKVRDLKKAGKVLSVVLGAGATTVNGPNFELDNRQAVEREALAAAAKDAKAKAQAIAEAAGVGLGEILVINPQTVNWPGPRPALFARALAMPMSADGGGEPMEAGEQTLTGFVTITYAIH